MNWAAPRPPHWPPATSRPGPASTARVTSSSASAPRRCTGWPGSSRRCRSMSWSSSCNRRSMRIGCSRFLVMVRQFARGDEASRKAIYELYLANTRHVNNWDLVDASAREIVGGYLADKGRKPLDRLAASPSLWERRISIVATHYFIRQQRLRRHAPDRRAAAGRPRGPDPQGRRLDAPRGRQEASADARVVPEAPRPGHAPDGAAVRDRAIPGRAAACLPRRVGLRSRERTTDATGHFALAAAFSRVNVRRVQPLPFSALNSVGRGLPGAAMQIVRRSFFELVDAQHALAPILAAVGDHVDRLRIARRVELDPRPGERLPVALPDDVVLVDDPRDRADDLVGCLLAVVDRRRGSPRALVPLELLLDRLVVGEGRGEGPRDEQD